MSRLRPAVRILAAAGCLAALLASFSHPASPPWTQAPALAQERGGDRGGGDRDPGGAEPGQDQPARRRGVPYILVDHGHLGAVLDLESGLLFCAGAGPKCFFAVSDIGTTITRQGVFVGPERPQPWHDAELQRLTGLLNRMIRSAAEQARPGWALAVVLTPHAPFLAWTPLNRRPSGQTVNQDDPRFIELLDLSDSARKIAADYFPGGHTYRWFYPYPDGDEILLDRRGNTAKAPRFLEAGQRTPATIHDDTLREATRRLNALLEAAARGRPVAVGPGKKDNPLASLAILETPVGLVLAWVRPVPDDYPRGGIKPFYGGNPPGAP